ncbi:DUF6714 family protein [Undibacterium sp. Ji49W]|uniref:DUF6714 family protein n=1 Tax=Undibacterium sp. Ji49W TaxID=3413040 RepID=UPI003BEF7D56
MDSKALFDEIELALPEVPMPINAELTFHKTDCLQCEYLRNELEENRDKEITGKLIRYLHMELSCLSSASWRWILPHYLKFSLTPEAVRNTFETQSIIFNLGPDPAFQADTKVRLSSLNQKQITCLVHFLEWLKNHTHWNEYCPEDIDGALKFMRSLTIYP